MPMFFTPCGMPCHILRWPRFPECFFQICVESNQWFTSRKSNTYLYLKLSMMWCLSMHRSMTQCTSAVTPLLCTNALMLLQSCGKTSLSVLVYQNTYYSTYTTCLSGPTVPTNHSRLFTNLHISNSCFMEYAILTILSQSNTNHTQSKLLTNCLCEERAGRSHSHSSPDK